MSARPAPRGNSVRRAGDPGHHQQGGAGRRDGGDFAAHRCPLGVAELVVEESEVEQQPEAGADVGGVQAGDVAADQAQLDARGVRVFAGAAQRP